LAGSGWPTTTWSACSPSRWSSAPCSAVAADGYSTAGSLPGGVIAVAFAVPDVWWQAQHQWAAIAMTHALNHENGGLPNIGVFVIGQPFLVALALAWVWVAGLRLLWPSGRPLWRDRRAELEQTTDPQCRRVGPVVREHGGRVAARPRYAVVDQDRGHSQHSERQSGC